MAIIFKVFSHSFLHGHMFFPHEFSLKSARILPIIVTVVKVLCKYKLSLVVCKKNDMPAVLFQNDTDMPFSNFSSLEPNPDHTDNVIELCRFRSVFFLFHLRAARQKKQEERRVPRSRKSFLRPVKKGLDKGRRN